MLSRFFSNTTAKVRALGWSISLLTYADMGDAERAGSYAKALLAARPEFTVADWERTQNCADDQRLAKDSQSLIDAGLP